MSNYNYDDDEEDEYGMGAPPREPPLTPPPGRPPQIPQNVPPPVMSSAPTLTPAPSYTPSPSAPAMATSSGPSLQDHQNTINQLQTQIGQLQAQVNSKDNQIGQLNSQLNSLNASIQGYQNQIAQLNNEKGQLQAQLPELQNQVSQLTEQNSMLAGQIGPLQAQIGQLNQELQYKEKRITELKEPKAVMASSLAQPTQSPGFGGGTSFGTSPAPTASPAVSSPAPTMDSMGEGGHTRRVCVNCGAIGPAIKEVEDRTRIISYIPKTIYAKKLVCTKCGFEF
ncbi:MAG: hypothetical protein ACFFBP_11130 [Promethearchaeota archaeon]